MADTAIRSDKAIGLGLAFGALAVLGSVVMYVTAAQQIVAGWGFALAVFAASVAVAAIHVFS